MSKDMERQKDVTFFRNRKKLPAPLTWIRGGPLVGWAILLLPMTL